MTVKELIEKLSKLDPEIECLTLDDNGDWCKIVDAWGESDPSMSDIKDFAYVEILGPVELKQDGIKDREIARDRICDLLENKQCH